jgi:D-alanyl-D-alanine carboxypeptidase
MDGDEFMTELYTDPQKVWTPWEKIERSLVGRDRTGPPGPPARYSDVGYVVAAMVIEAATNAPLHLAFRRYLAFEDLGLDVIHLEWLEPTPRGAGPRVRHLVDERDVTDIHPSCDLWGAGGLVSDARDLARWWHALFAGQIFDDPASLQTMLTTTPEPDAGRDMGLGIYRRTIDGQDIWAHGGYWGAYPLHNQTTGITAVVLINQCLDHAGPAFRDFALNLVNA